MGYDGTRDCQRLSLNAQHPLMQIAKPVFAYLVEAEQTAPVMDAYLREPAGLSTGAVVHATRKYLGPSFYHGSGASAGGLKFSLGGSAQKINAPVGIIWVATVEMVGFGTTGRLISTSNATNGGLRCGVTTGGAIECGYNGVATTSLGTVLTVGLPYCIAISFDASSIAGAATAVVRRMDTGIFTISTATPTGTALAGDNVYSVGAMAAVTTNFFNGYISLAAAFAAQAVVPASTLVEITRDPWALFDRIPDLSLADADAIVAAGNDIVPLYQTIGLGGPQSYGLRI